MKLTGYTVSEFASLMRNSEKSNTNNTLYGTVVYVDGKLYVNIDGSTSLTPATTESEVKEGERVSVSIQNHSAVIRGNADNPSASTGTVTDNYNEFTDTTESINSKLASLTVSDTSITAQVRDLEGSIASLTIESGRIAAQVSDIEGSIADLTIESDNIVAKVEGAVTYIKTVEGTIEGMEGSIEGMEESIEVVEEYVTALELRADQFDVTVRSKADSSNIISTINASREGIKISSSKINITGMVTFEDLSGAGKSVINGSNITGGTISAANEINFVGGARIFGNTGQSNAGLYISASQFSFTGASQSFMNGNWDVSGKLVVKGNVTASSSLSVSSTVSCSTLSCSGYGTMYYLTISSGLDCNTLSVNDTAWIEKAYISGAWVSSDRRLKTDIRYVDDGPQMLGESGWMSPNVNIHKSDMLEFIETLPIVSYRYKKDVENEKDITHYGIITQDVLYTKVGSELVKVLDDEKQIGDEDDLMGYSPEKLMIFMCGALQEEIKARKALEDRVNRLGE